jgi:hypothetical protein
MIAFVETANKTSMNVMHHTFEKVIYRSDQKLIHAYSDLYDQGNRILALGFGGKNDPLYVIGPVAGGSLHPLHFFPARRDFS